MSIKAIMQAEVEHMDMLSDLAERMDWETDHPQYKRRLKAITREASTSIVH